MLHPGRLLSLTFSLIYKISRWLRFRFTPAGFLLLSAVVTSGIFGIDTRASMAYQIFSITVSILIMSVLTSLIFRGNFRLHRQLPEFGTVAYPLKYKVTIDNLDKGPHQDLMFVDELSSGFPSYETFKSSRDPDDKNRNWVDRKIGYPRLMS